MPTLTTITDAQIKQLACEAGEAGDTEQVAICRRALGYDESASSREILIARGECADLIARYTGGGR